MALYHDFLVEDREFSSYEDFKQNCRLKAPNDFNFAYNVVDRYADEEPEKVALVWCDDRDERKFTFKELSEKSKQTANFLVAQGVKKGDAVMLILRRRYEYWWFILALDRIGAIAIPATVQLLAKDLVYRINASGLKMIVAVDSPKLQCEIECAVRLAEKSPLAEKKTKQKITLVMVGESRDGWICFNSEFEKFKADFPRPEGAEKVVGSDPMLIYFTSGTSGEPKMVCHNNFYPIAHIITAKYWQNVIDGGLHFSVAETGWGKASWGKIYGQWLGGSAVFVYDMISFKPDVLLRKIAKYGVTTFCAPPTIYRYLVRQDLSKYDFSSLKDCYTAGEALNGEVFNKFKEATGFSIHEGYGQTESTVICANFPWMEIKPGSMGMPAPNFDVEIIDENENRSADNEVGEIAIRVGKSGENRLIKYDSSGNCGLDVDCASGKNPFGLFTGYYHDDSKTSSVFASGFYHTGDMAYRDADGYIWFVGRKDDIIKSAGNRVSPFEVESVLQEHPAVLECAVTGVEDANRGSLVKATIVLSDGFEPSRELEKEILEFAKKEIAHYKLPRVVEFVTELPKTISGKIKRFEIRK